MTSTLLFAGIASFASPASAAAVLVAPVPLGTAASYSVLSGASVGNTAGVGTIVRGDLGISPFGALTGFEPGNGVVTGTIHNGDAPAAQAFADFGTAYSNAAGRPQTADLVADLIGLTLAPGVHHSAAAVGNTGIVTLDGQGDPNSVFIFQIGGAFTMAALTQVKLTNGTRAANVFWQVNGAATVGAGASFAGTVMAQGAGAIGAGSLVNGRVLVTAAVGLNNNSFYTNPPVVTIAGGATVSTNDSTPTITGTAPGQAPATVVTVTIAGQTLTAPVQGDGTWTVTSALLANATYFAVASITDPAGNTGSATQALTVDTVLPVVTITGGAAASTSDTTPTIAGTTDVGVDVTVTVTVAGQTLTTLVQPGGTWNVTPVTLENGTHTVVASVADMAGNPGSATQALTVDTVLPVVTITGGPTASAITATPTITGTAPDVPAGTTVTVTINGQSLTASTLSNAWTVTAALLPNGTYPVVASVTDPAGNTGTANQALTVDTTLPTVTIAGGAARSTNDVTPTIMGTTDVAAGAVVTVTVAGQTLTALVQPGGTWNVTPAALAPDTHSVVVSVTDPAGNPGSTTQTLTIDTSAPTITVAGGPARSTNDPTPTITGTTTEPAGTTVTVSVAGQTLTATVLTGGMWSVTPALLANGTHTVAASMTDMAGNAGSATQALTVDTAAPTVTISGGPTRSTSDTTPTINGTTDEPLGSTVTVTVAGQTMTATVQAGSTWTVTPSTLINGSHDVVASVTDAAENAGSATQALTVDTAAPTVTISGGPTRSTNDTTPTITGTTDVDAGSTFTVTVAGQTMTATVLPGGTWSATPATLANGAHAVAASVSDAAGNSATVTQVLTIDTSAPTVTISGGPTRSTNDMTPTITGTTDEPAGTTVTVTAAGQSLTTTVLSGGAWTVDAAELVDGPYDVVASVTDAAENVGSATQALTIDTSAPTITIAGGATRSTNDTTPTITGTTNAAAGTTVTVTVAGQTMTPMVQTGGTWSVIPVALTGGSHDVAASVTDSAGNAGSTTQALTIDTAAPTITIAGGPTRSTNDATPTITGTTDEPAGTTVTVTVAGQTLTTSVQSGGTWSVDPEALSLGSHDVAASVTDAAGNAGSTTQALTIDTAAPTITIAGGATRSTNEMTPTITGSTSEAAGTTVTVTVAGQTLLATVLGNGTWTVDAAELVDGPYDVLATVTDAAENLGSATQALTIDTAAPTITIAGGATRSTNDMTPTITGTTSEAAGATLTVTVAGQTLPATVQSGGTWSVDPSALTTGSHGVAASVTDAAGNTTTATQALSIDTAAPTVTIAGGTTRTTNIATPTIVGTTDEPAGTTVTVTVAGQTLTASVQTGGTWSVTPAALSDGAYDVVASVTDAAGNAGSETQALSVDTAAPAVTISGGPARSTNIATPTITGTTSESAGATLTVTVAAQTLTAMVQSGGTWSVTPLAALASGTHTVVASVTDPAGNPGSASQALTIDTAAPTVTITGGAIRSTNDATPTITGTTSEATGATVTVTVAGQTLTASVQSGGTWNATPEALANGSHGVEASVTDAAGNTTSATQALTVDTVLPAVTISGGPTRSTQDTTPTITGSADVAGSTVTVTIGGDTLTALVQSGGTWNVTPAALADGAYDVTASVTDPAGNTASASQALTVDNVRPALTITGGPTASTNDATPTISGTTDVAAGTTVTVTVAGHTMTATAQGDGTWTVSPAALADGTHDVAASVADPAGNTRTATQALTVDTTVPPVTDPPVTDPPVTGSAFSSVGPKRVFDTRPGQSTNALRNVLKQKVGGVHELEVKVTDLVGFVPATGVGAVSLTVTATNADEAGFITVYACGTRESVSSVNYMAGEIVANAVIAPVSAMGTVCFFSSAPTDIIADVNGWFAAGEVFSSVGPKRVFDTRPGSAPALRSVNQARIQAGNIIEVQLTDLPGFVPATGVGSVSLNVTVTNPAAAGFITVYSCGPLELVSSVNYIAGQTVANAVIAPVSDAGAVCFYTSATADLIVDINGWLKSSSGFTAVSPRRVLDTRPGQSTNALREVLEEKIGGEYVLQVKVTDLPGVVPATGVSAVSLNVTATNPDGDGFVTVYPCGTREEVSSLNYRAGQTVANAVLSPVSATGTICLYSFSPADVVVDINGWFGDGPQSG